MAARPLINNHIQRALKIISNVGYETRCYKKGHRPQQLIVSAIFTLTATHAKPPIHPFFLIVRRKRYRSKKCCQ